MGLQRHIDAYFDSLESDDPPTVFELAGFLGISSVTLFRYERGNCGNEFSNTVKKAKDRIKNAWMKSAAKERVNASVGIFVCKSLGVSDRPKDDSGKDDVRKAMDTIKDWIKDDE